jgi:hypothetical protein
MNTQSSPLQWDPAKLHFDFPIPNRETRFKELVLYIAQECLDDPTYSLIKLLKILFYSDFESYGRYGTPITGLSYKKLPFGPVPAAFRRIEDEMLRDKLIRIVKRRVFDQSSHRLLPLQDPSYDLFTARDISIVGGWIRFFWNMSAKAVSEYSHGKAWKLANESDLIPYEAVFISDEPVTQDDVERAKDLAIRHEWKV